MIGGHLQLDLHGKFSHGTLDIPHPKVDMAPEPSMTPLQREPTGNTEESNEADYPGTLQVLPGLWPSASAGSAFLLLVSWAKLYQDVPSSVELLPANPLNAGTR